MRALANAHRVFRKAARVFQPVRRAVTEGAGDAITKPRMQSGKSETSAIGALHEPLTKPGALILVLSPTLRQSGLLFKRVKKD